MGKKFFLVVITTKQQEFSFTISAEKRDQRWVAKQIDLTTNTSLLVRVRSLLSSFRGGSSFSLLTERVKTQLKLCVYAYVTDKSDRHYLDPRTDQELASVILDAKVLEKVSV